MIVVSDTSPITALITVRQVELLQELFDEMFVPQAVQTELLRTHATLPTWIHTQEVAATRDLKRFSEIVDAGEAEAIALAKEMHADRLLIDERKGRRLALAEGIHVIGLVGVVLLAKRKGRILSARVVMDRLVNEAGVYLDPELVNSALQSVGE